MKTRFTKIVTAAMLAVCFFAFRAGAFTAKVSGLEGQITFKQGETETWEEAETGLSLASGDELRSGRESWAEISFSQGHMTRLGPESYMEIGTLEEETNLELFNGELLSKVRELASNENFKIATPESVVSVKGTEFFVSVDESLAETLVKVFSGQVSAVDIGSGQEVLIPAGSFSRLRKDGSPSEPQDLSQLGESADETDPGEELAREPEDEIVETPEETGEESQEPLDPQTVKQDLRNEIRSAINDIRIDIREAQDVIEHKKESDSATGRTMKDSHGNLVRVEQHLMRPHSDTLQFINITKRDNYNYKGRMNVASSGARLDYFETKIEFNRNIPEKVSGWFDFAKKIEDNDEDFHPEVFKMKISNNADSIRVESEWDYTNDELGDPDIFYESARQDTKGTWKAKKDSEGNIVETGSGINMDADEKIEMWAISPATTFELTTDPNKTKDIRLGMEGWLINNDGKVFNVKDLEDANTNPFDIIKKIAFQMSVTGRYGFASEYILAGDNVENTAKNREDALNGFNEAENFFLNNFDLVATPDIVVNIMEEIAKNADFDSMGED